MAYIRLPLGIRVAMELNYHGKPVVNIYHVTTSDPIVQVKLETIATVFLDWWELHMSGNVSSSISSVSCTALSLDVPNGIKAQVFNTVPVPGTLAVEAVPNNVALAVTFRTAKTGRSFQGRSYVAGFADSEVIGNDLYFPRLSAIIQAHIDLDTLLTVAGTELVVASFQAAGVPRAEGVATQVSGFAANQRVDTQRRRLPKS